MERSLKKLVLSFAVASLLPEVVKAASPVAYNTILVIVIIELIFAFAIGVVCILFSFNLLRALKDASAETLTSGDLPPRVGDGIQSRTFPSRLYYTDDTLSNRIQYNPLRERESEDFSHYHDAEDHPPATTPSHTPHNGVSEFPMRQSSVGSEWDYEIDSRQLAKENNTVYGKMKGVLSTFTSYIKPW